MPSVPIDIASWASDIWNNLKPQYCLALFLGAVIVYTFASSRYNVPTFTRTSIGNLAQLSPKSLAPDSRYQKGFHIYFLSLLGLYITLCVIGPKALAIPGLLSSEAWKDPTLWPIGVASALTAMGIAGDNKFPGNIENFFRRKAHESAYIPTAVATLSHQIASFDLAGWLKATEPNIVDSIQTMSGGESIGSISKAAALGEGRLASWVRGNVLLHCLHHLSGERYDGIKAQDENKDAAKFLGVLHDSIKSRLSASPNLSSVTIDTPLSKDLESFVDGASVLLASTLLQAAPDARNLSATITKLGFKEIDSANPQTWAQFATFTVALLLGIPLVVWLFAFLFSDTMFHYGSQIMIGLGEIRSQEIPNYGVRIGQMAASTAIVYGVAFIVLMYVREKRLTKEPWEEKLGSQLDLAKWGGVPAGLLATVVILLLPGIDLQGAQSIAIFNLVLSLIASMFFVLHMRSAARAIDTPVSIAKRVFGAGTWIHAVVALIASIALSFVTVKYNTESWPVRSMTDVSARYQAVVDSIPKRDANSQALIGSQNWEAMTNKVDNDLRNVRQTLQTFLGAEGTSIAAAAALEALNGQVAGICTLLNPPAASGADVLSPRPSNAKSLEPTVASCHLIQSQERDVNPLERSVVQFAKALVGFRKDVENLNSYRLGLANYKESLAICLIAGLFAVFGSLTFAVSVRFGRIEQLRNEIDRFDEGTIERLRRRAACHFMQTGSPVDLERWLATPNSSIGLLTPLEGIRYRLYRASLFDSLLNGSSESPPLAPEPGAGAQVPVHV